MIDLASFTSQQHINTTSNPHKNFGEDSKGLNEFIGALQITNIALTKILKEIESCELEDCVSKEELEVLQKSACIRIDEIIQNTKFMGISLFDTPLSAKVSGSIKGICFENPLALSHDFVAMKGFVEDKRAESNDLLLALSEALIAPTDTCFESVDSTKLANMFKS
ncbi:flagellar FLiS export co-chaperone [uncultured Helicobacter sp.]|uniref:flagellar FLiS export co-chaperone n=2 Tax=uncultured Helicobacter sp. TaxID=175537 RepID=UPI00374FB41C